MKFAQLILPLSLLGHLLLYGCSTASKPTNHSSIRVAVASVNPIATDAGLAAIAEGGNAIDAAIAIALTLGVVDTHNSGIGGGCFMLIHRADGTLLAIDGREMAPSAAYRDMYIKDGKPMTKASKTGALAIGIPGSLAAYHYASLLAGDMDLADHLRNAACVAQNGFPIDSTLAARLKATHSDLKKFKASAAIFLDAKQKPWPKNHHLKQSDLAKTYRQIADKGINHFYEGEFAEKTAAWMKQNKGIVQASDFANYHLVIRRSVISHYRGHTIIGFPPASSGGVHVAQILNILQHFNLKKLDQRNPALRYHVIAEAMKLAFADRAHWLGDPAFAKVPKALAGPAYAKHLAQKINLGSTINLNSHGIPPNTTSDIFAPGIKIPAISKKDTTNHSRNSPPPNRASLTAQAANNHITLTNTQISITYDPVNRHTTHIATADSQGNWVALTTTLNTSFGSKVVIPGTGVIMNNQMDDFSIQPGVPNAFGLIGAEANAIAPGKRPLSSMSPTIVLKDGKPVMTFGAAGGPTIITQIVQTIVNHIDLGLPLQQAIAAPRIHHQWRPNILFAEKAIPPHIVKTLNKLGHKTTIRTRMGVTQGIILSNKKTFSAVHDPRIPSKAATR